MREEHEKYNEDLDHMIRQEQLKLDNGGTVSEAEIEQMISLMGVMTLDTREINKQAIKCGEPDIFQDPKKKAFDNILDDILF